MKLPRLLNTPLAATAGVLVGLSLLAIPLHQLTSAQPELPPEIAKPSTSSTTPSWVTLKLLDPASTVQLRLPTGESLWTVEQISAGTHETQLELPITDGTLEVVLEIRLQNGTQETAAFITIAPDGLETQTGYAIGNGNLTELITFTWPNP